jgi:hypothetical protein
MYSVYTLLLSQDIIWLGHFRAWDFLLELAKPAASADENESATDGRSRVPGPPATALAHSEPGPVTRVTAQMSDFLLEYGNPVYVGRQQ